MEKQYLTSARFIKGNILTIISNIFLNKNLEVNNTHKGYVFLNKTNAINFRKAGTSGIFSNSKGKKLFIKDYVYILKDLDFEYLHNEINTLKALSNVGHSKENVNFPHLVDSIDENKRITIITEYNEGITLDKMQQDLIQEVLINVLRFLKKESKSLSSKSQSLIPGRSHWLTFITYPFNIIRVLIKEPNRINLFIKATFVFLKYTKSYIFQKIPYGIAHRDLSADNIIFNSKTKQTIIIDTECMVKTDILYDLALLPRLYVKLLTANQLISIIGSLNLNKNDFKRLILLMISSCINKIATETKNSRDYKNAVAGLDLTLKYLIPNIEKSL